MKNQTDYDFSLISALVVCDGVLFADEYHPEEEPCGWFERGVEVWSFDYQRGSAKMTCPRCGKVLSQKGEHISKIDD